METVTNLFGYFGEVQTIEVVQYKDVNGGVHSTAEEAKKSNIKIAMATFAEKMIEAGYAGESQRQHTVLRNIMADAADFIANPDLKVTKAEPENKAKPKATPETAPLDAANKAS